MSGAFSRSGGLDAAPGADHGIRLAGASSRTDHAIFTTENLIAPGYMAQMAHFVRYDAKLA
ncbi:MAG TPA: hypothetical protein DEO85_13730 [Maritimibacter sp.]|nr:hypothetical protein [Maritimibacter sp.]